MYKLGRTVQLQLALDLHKIVSSSTLLDICLGPITIQI